MHASQAGEGSVTVDEKAAYAMTMIILEQHLLCPHDALHYWVHSLQMAGVGGDADLDAFDFV